MIYKIIPFLLLLSATIHAQTPSSITLDGKVLNNSTSAELACADQDAGEIALVNFIGQSNDISLDTIFFCLGDQIDILHTGGSDLTGDPNPLTAPGITYGFYDCEPTIMGPDLAAILSEPCILDDPPPANGIFVVTEGTPSGDVTFFNDGGLQTTFNGGDPILIWFAPLTVDDFANRQFEEDPTTGITGPCVNVSTDFAFAAVYLNEIDIDNLDNAAANGGCVGSFFVNGGLPEFDGSDYNIEISLATDPTIQADIVNQSGITHGDSVSFIVPQAGLYSIVIEDGKSCEASFLVDMTGCQELELTIEDANVPQGDNFCIDVTVGDGFFDLVAMNFSINYDPSVFTFNEAINFNPNVEGLDEDAVASTTPGEIIFLWFFNTVPENLPANSVLFQLCFNASGLAGACSSVSVTNDPIPIEVGVDDNPNLGTIALIATDGTVCIDGGNIDLTFTTENNPCPDDVEGSFTVNIAGGTAPYDITWQNIDAGPVQGPTNVTGNTYTTPIGLVSGDYAVTVTDGNSSSVDTVTVATDPGFIVNLIPTAPSCNDQQGSVTAEVIDANTNMLVTDFTGFSFQWSNGSTINTSGPLDPGGYTLVFTDPNGCEQFLTGVLIPPPPPIQVDIVNLVQPSCSGIDDGQMLVQISGGTPTPGGNYQIEWPDLGISTSNLDQSNLNTLEAGCYLLVVTDANGCIDSSFQCLTAEVQIVANAIITDPPCADTNTGSIQVIASTNGATAATPYTFNWSAAPPIGGVPTNTPTTSSVSGLGTLPNGIGMYAVTITDQNGCMIDTVLTITDPPELEASVLTITNETCLVGNDGTATLLVTGGTYPYSYDWGSGIAPDSVVTDLAAGTYTVTVTDDNLCTDTTFVLIDSSQPPIILSFENDTLDCGAGANGVLTIVPENPALIDTYTWSPPAVSNIATASNLPAGFYDVTVTALDGCTTVETAQVISPTPLTVDDIITTSPPCPGDADGQISLVISGGTTPYFFDWPTPLDVFDGPNNSSAGGNIVFAGTYIITVTDANGCPPLEVTAVLDDPLGLDITFSNIDSVSCFQGICDGAATAMAVFEDGTPGLFDFTWESGEADNSVEESTANNLCAGFQTVNINFGVCNVVDSVFIGSPEDISVNSNMIIKPSCFGDADGSIEIEVEGGTAPYNVNWDNGETGLLIVDLTAGSYTVSIQDGNNCSTSAMIGLGQPDLFEVSIGDIQDVECDNLDNGFVQIETTGGTNDFPLNYNWSGNIGTPNSGLANNLMAGDYSVTVTDNNGCQDSIDFSIDAGTPIEFFLNDYQEIPCFNELTFITVDSASGGTGQGFTFEVDNFGQSNLGVLYPVFAGEHVIRVYDEGTTEECFVDTTIFLSEPLPITINFDENIEIELGDTLYQLTPDIIASTPIDSFFWSPTVGLLCPNDTFMTVNCSSPFVNITETSTFDLLVVDENGCEATASVTIEVDDNRNVFIPNVFSPNDDGANDIFQVYTGLGVAAIPSFRVFNRYGSIVYEDLDVEPSQFGTQGWDGRFGGERLNPDVYVYLIEVEFLDGRKLLYRGDVSLLR